MVGYLHLVSSRFCLHQCRPWGDTLETCLIKQEVCSGCLDTALLLESCTQGLQ